MVNKKIIQNKKLKTINIVKCRNVGYVLNIIMIYLLFSEKMIYLLYTFKVSYHNKNNKLSISQMQLKLTFMDVIK